MKKETTKPESPAVQLHHKFNHFTRQQRNETQIFYEYLQTNVATASMVTAAIGLAQKNICRYKRELEKMGMLWEVTYKRCVITGFKAAYLTTNPGLIPPTNNRQLSLFEESEVCYG